MAYYLQLDGVDDSIYVDFGANISHVIIDFAPDIVVQTKKTSFILDAYMHSFYSVKDTATSNYREYIENCTVLKNGVQVFNNTDFIPHNAKERMTLQVSFQSPQQIIYFFDSYSGGSCFKASIYSMRFYNGTILVADFDMTSGNLLDKSGNNRAPTMTGGTWVQDAPVAIDVLIVMPTKQLITVNAQTIWSAKQAIINNTSIAIATKQTIIGSHSIFTATKQVITNNHSIAVVTNQAFLSHLTTDFPTRQMVVNYVSTMNDTEQKFTLSFLAEFPTFGKIYGDYKRESSTKQELFNTSSMIIPTIQTIHKPTHMESPINQIIYSLLGADFLTFQKVFDGYVNVYENYPLKIIVTSCAENSHPVNQLAFENKEHSNHVKIKIFKIKKNDAESTQIITAETAVLINTKQMTTTDKLWEYGLLVKSISGDLIVPVTKIYGQRILSVPITGQKNASIPISGQRILYVTVTGQAIKRPSLVGQRVLRIVIRGELK